MAHKLVGIKWIVNTTLRILTRRVFCQYGNDALPTGLLRCRVESVVRVADQLATLS